jgi:leader peptidase (prepilin peptidase)/N-methyltransferase
MKDWIGWTKQWQHSSLTAKGRRALLYAGLAALLLVALQFLLLPVAEAACGVPLACALVLLSLIDWNTRRLPDALTLPLLALGFTVAIADLGPSLLAALIGAALGYAALALLAFAYRRIRGFDGLGLGDAKLLAALGAWNGAEALPATILVAATFALSFYLLTRSPRRRIQGTDELPFGPFLALAGWCVFIATRVDAAAAAFYFGVA